MQRLNLDRPRLPRNREVRACQQCRSAKVKCDRGKPWCQRCLAYNRQCVYEFNNLKKEERRIARPVSLSLMQDSKASETSEIYMRDKAISLNRVGHLTSASDTWSRHYSSESWISGLEDFEPITQTTSPDTPTSVQIPHLWPHTSLQMDIDTSTELVDDLVSRSEVDKLLCWYSDYCHLWFPVVNITETVLALDQLRNHKPCAPGSASLIAAICYVATCSAEEASDMSPSKLSPTTWLSTAKRLLTISMYPSQPNYNTIRAAFLLALPNINEASLYEAFPLICVLVRAAQYLGLHREPLGLQVAFEEAESRRVLWWSILGLDVAYSLAHALPPLIHPRDYDVRMVSALEDPNRRLLVSMTRINVAICHVLENIYGARQPTLSVLQRLDQEVEERCANEVSELDRPGSLPPERFLVLSQRACCWKLKYILHQPYLRSAQWPQSSRRKALDACKKYIADFCRSVIEPDLAPYRWILNHFNIFHACAILLQDLISFPNSAESVELRIAVESCFSTFYAPGDSTWQRLESLRSKAWITNKWDVTSHQAGDVGDVSLSDWDPLFASLIWEDALAPEMTASMT